MLQVHIGAPGVAPDLLAIISESERVRRAENVYFVQPSEYQALFQEIVNGRIDVSQADEETIWEISDFKDQVKSLDRIVISQPRFLGYPHDGLRSRKAFPMAESRAGRLSAIFSGQELHFHLTITSQVDYILRMRRIAQTDRVEALYNARLSWSELVSRIRRGAPERHVTVWDFERPKSTARTYVEAILGLQLPGLYDLIQKGLSHNMKQVGSGTLDLSDLTIAKSVERLDALYEYDLNVLEKMDGVTLVR